MKRLGIDIGGTFTDFYFWDDDSQQTFTKKVPTSVVDPSIAAVDGLQKLCKELSLQPSDLDYLSHGTTVATNIILQHDGSKVGLITTHGFRDILHIGRKDRPYNFSNYQNVPRQSKPIVKRRFRCTVNERINASGDIDVPLNIDDVKKAVKKLREAKVDAIAICCLFSFLNSSHEEEIAEIVRSELPNVFVSLSHEVSPLFREYERFSTTALNAYVGPRTSQYVSKLSTRLKDCGVKSELNLMSSAGGSVSQQQASNTPVSLLLSGPVAALIAGVEIGKQIGHPSVITLDVGGTSTDIGVALNGRVRMKHLLDTQIGAYDAMVPMADIDTIGAGGGSIAYIDAGGMFRVGPMSAGAQPGPASYGHGGDQATVTDALCCFGWFRASALEASGLHLQPELAEHVIATNIAEPLEMSIAEAANGIFQVIVNNMVQAIRVNSVSKGLDPRDFALIAYGGAGGAFVAEVGRQLNVAKVVIPPHPGVGAACGLLNSDTKYEEMATMWMDLSEPDFNVLERNYSELSNIVTNKLIADGFTLDDIEVRFQADCRYQGQGYELIVDAPQSGFEQDWVDNLIESFHSAHEEMYLRRFSDVSVHLINCRVTGIGKMSKITSSKIAAGNKKPSASALLEQLLTWFPTTRGVESFDTPFYDRHKLKSGNCITGPAVIEQDDSTSIIPPDVEVSVDEYGNLIMQIPEQSA